MKTTEQILQRLSSRYRGARTELRFENPLQLLIATILSSQCTDKRVNEITPRLFARFPTAQDFADASLEEIETIIKGCGLYRSKARYIRDACRKIVKEFNGQVPSNRQDLMSLPGVGRKTANVVLANAFGQQAMAVDTHVFRVANRVGLADSQNVLEVERQLMKVIPQHWWAAAHHWLIQHGRKVCRARNPNCSVCLLSDLCRWHNQKD